MLLRELLGLLRCCWPSLLLHCAFHPLWGSFQITRGEPQKSCSKPIEEKVTESCQEICQCRPPPPLPPPPPPPPPPRLLVVPTPKSTFCPTEDTWWPGLVIIIAVCCATLVFLFVVVIICYKAIKSPRSPPPGLCVSPQDSAFPGASHGAPGLTGDIAMEDSCKLMHTR
ncbi:proline-rich membrane anchor 1 isoform X2 [Calypte anna]|uniref:proline-rich membrane anchor 1 isoform X2 n=1 Tax=Calypte anna TaxID=9244 RepID=UPI0011C4006F|nr:proline-rich membrane anchor 1 isoform X2 [Calypte anna]